MTCPNCKQPVEDAALFCGNCGFHVRQETAPTPATTVAAAPVPSASGPDAAAAPTVPAATSPQPPAVPAPTSQPAQPAQPQPVSAYDVLQPATQKHTLELVLAILSIPAAIIPIIGFGLGVPALVLARKHGGNKAIAPTVLASIGIVLSTAVLIFNIVYYVQHPEEHTGVRGSTQIAGPLHELAGRR